MRPREDIKQDMGNAHSALDNILLIEVLLDIREHLGKLVMSQGVQKWGAKLGPAAVDPATHREPQQVEFGGQDRER